MLRHPDVVSGGKSRREIAEWNALARAMGDTDAIITPSDLRYERRARRAISEYALHKSGVTYAQQGYAFPDGQLPYIKLQTHLIITDVIAREQRNK